MRDGLTVLIGIMVAAILIVNLFGTHSTSPRPPSARPKVAIIRFNNQPGIKGLGQGLAEMLSARLEKTRRYNLIEQQVIDQALSQMEQAEDQIDPEEAVEIGKKVEVNYVILGSILKVWLDPLSLHLKVSLQLIRTDTGEVIATPQVQGRAGRLFSGISKEDLLETTFQSKDKAAQLLRGAALKAVDKFVAGLVEVF